jgi:hypothetical protein
MNCNRKVRNGLLLATTLGVASLGAGTASADITYMVDRTVSNGTNTGTVVGSITTDGVLGTLTTADIIAWTLTLNGVGASFTIANTDSNAFKEIVGTDVTATVHDLLFNFSGPTGNLLLQDGAFQGTHYYCDETGGGPCFLGESDVPISFNDPSAVYSDPVPTGSQIIGAAIPELSTWALMLLGFASLGCAGYYRARRPSAAAVG